MKRLLIAGIAVIIIAALILAPKTTQEQQAFSGKIDLIGQGIADADQQKVAFFQIETNFQELTPANVSWQIFEKPVPDQIFVLDGPRIDASQYPQFRTELEKLLKAEGKNLNSVTLQNLNTLPTAGFLLIPSGSLPETFLKDGFLEKLIAKNTTILFFGLPFDVTLASDGSPTKNKDLWLNQTKKLGFEYAEANNAKAKNHSFTKSQYAVRLNTQNNATKILIYDDTIYSISYLNQGTLAIIPNTLDNGWPTGQAAAQDITKIINNGEWQPPLANQITNQNLEPGQNTLVSPSFDGNKAYAQLKISSQNETHRFSSIIEALPSRQINQIEAAPGEKISASTTLNQNYPTAKQLDLTLEAVKNGKTIDKTSAGTATVKNLGYASTSLTAPTETGDYLLQMKDQDNQIHAQSVLHVTNMTARFIREDYGDGAFSVQILKDGQPQANAAYRISLDGANNKTLTTDENGVASFNTRASLNPTHTLTFYGPKSYFQIQRPHIDADFLNSPIAYGIILLIMIIFGGGYLFAVKTKTKYYIDIPDFPSEPAQNRTIDAHDVANAFERANKHFGGRYSPLTLLEIKDALKEQLELPTRTSLTDANIQTLMDELEKRRAIKSARGYFVLTEWEKRIHQTAEFMALKRMAVDELVKHGQPYQETPCNELKTNSFTLHLFDEKNLPKIETSLERNKSLLVFPNRQDLNDFVHRLKTNTDSLSIRLYLELTHGTYRAICVEQIGEATKP